MFVLKIIIGLLGGTVAGMGMGGGSLTIPLLTLVLHLTQIKAQGINLVAFLPMSVVALVIHTKNKLVEYKKTIGLALIGCVFSLITALIANHMKNIVLKRLFAIFLIGLGIWQIYQILKHKQGKKKTKEQ